MGWISKMIADKIEIGLKLCICYRYLLIKVQLLQFVSKFPGKHFFTINPDSTSNSRYVILRPRTQNQAALFRLFLWKLIKDEISCFGLTKNNISSKKKNICLNILLIFDTENWQLKQNVNSGTLENLAQCAGERYDPQYF